MEPSHRKVAAILALQVSEGKRWYPPPTLQTRIADQLLGHGDVEGVALGQADSMTTR